MSKTNFLIGLLLAFLLTGCAAQRAYKDGQNLFEQGKVEEGLAQIEKAYKLDPDNSEYRGQYFKRREAVAYQWLSQAEAAKGKGEWEEAEAYYRRILAVDSANPRAKTGLSTLGVEKKHAQLLIEAKAQLDKSDLAGASKKVRIVLSEAPSQPLALKLQQEIAGKVAANNNSRTTLKSKLAHPITIEFKDAPIRAVFDSISKVAGVNFLYDKEVRPDLRSNLIVHDARIEDVIRFILFTNQLEQRTLNGNTLFIYPNTPQKLKDFQGLQIKNFYLVNARAKELAATIKSMLKSKDLYVDETLNMITMRDTPDAIRVAERLMAARDVAEPEVMLEVEVLEVGSNTLDNIGIQYPSQASVSVVGVAGVAGSATLQEFNNASAGLVRVNISDPALILNLLHQSGDTNLLANPRIRVKNHEKANVHIGDKLPVITNTTTATGIVSQSITYLDVGLKLDVEPTVYLDNEVGIKVGMEVSSISKQIQNTNGSLTYQIGTRNASTMLRLKDGETQILAGLINREDRKSANSVPVLGEIPILGRLFSTHSDSAAKTEVVLLITPRIIRNIVRPESNIEEFDSGTESAFSLDPLEINRAEISKDNKVAEAELSTMVVAGDTPKLTDAVLPVVLGNVKISLDAPAQAQAEKPFTVKFNLVADGLQNALLDISYDPTQLKVLSVAEGDLLKKQDGKTQFLQQVQEKAGRVSLSVLRQGDVQGEGSLASMTFQTLPGVTGGAQLRIGAANFSNAAGKVLPFNALPTATVEITK